MMHRPLAARVGQLDTDFGLGSVKSNFGHLEAAAGIAGLIKTVLALGHRQIPPSLLFKTPNPQLELEGSPFYVNTELRPWTRPGGDPCGPACRTLPTTHAFHYLCAAAHK